MLRDSSSMIVGNIMELGLHFSSRSTGAIVVTDQSSLLAREVLVTRELSENLPLVVRDQIKIFGGTLPQLSRIGVVVGPGALTPLRISVAFANTLGTVLKIPVVGLSAFDVYVVDGWVAMQLVVLQGRGRNVLVKGYLRDRGETISLFGEIDMAIDQLERLIRRFQVKIGVVFNTQSTMDELLTRLPNLNCRCSETAAQGVVRVMSESSTWTHGASVDYAYPAV